MTGAWWLDIIMISTPGHVKSYWNLKKIFIGWSYNVTWIRHFVFFIGNCFRFTSIVMYDWKRNEYTVYYDYNNWRSDCDNGRMQYCSGIEISIGHGHCSNHLWNWYTFRTIKTRNTRWMNLQVKTGFFPPLRIECKWLNLVLILDSVF